MSLSNAQRQILRGMADGAELKSLWSTRGVCRASLLDGRTVSGDDLLYLYRFALIAIADARGADYTYTLTPAGAEAAREGTG